MSQALRPMFIDCSPVCITVPQTTSSTVAGSMPERLISSFMTIDPSRTEWKLLSFPFRLPRGVRTASTITTSRITFSPLVSPSATLHSDGLVTSWTAEFDFLSHLYYGATIVTIHLSHFVSAIESRR